MTKHIKHCHLVDQPNQQLSWLFHVAETPWPLVVELMFIDDDTTKWQMIVKQQNTTIGPVSSLPSESNCVSWWVPGDVTSRRVDVTDSLSGLNESDFGSQSFMSSPTADISQIHFPLSHTYMWDVCWQATMSVGDLKSLTLISVSRWCVVELNLKIDDDSAQTM